MIWKTFAYIVLLTSVYSEDLYDVLGVRKGASTQEIKTAYKKMAREWHPDKNKAPEATDRFTKINEAYETLSDADKRRDYDNFGYTTAQERPQQRQPDFGFPFDDLFTGQGFKFNGGFGGFGSHRQSIIDKHLTTLRNYQSKIHPESQRTPCFLYAFGNFCFNCMRIEHIMEKFMEELETVGLCMATVHVQQTPDLAAHLRVHNVPLMMGLVGGRLTYYSASSLDLHSLRDFVRDLFPKDTLTQVTDANVDAFLNGWRHNKMVAVFFASRLTPSVRFLSPAFAHRDRVSFGYVSTAVPDAQQMMLRFNVNKRRESLLMFNEESGSPVASISMQQIPHRTLEEVIESNRFLMLPRLSSQSVFDELCPKEPKLKRRKLCVALVTRKIPEHDEARDKFRQFAAATAISLQPERLRFVYLYADVQKKIMDALAKGNATRSQTVLEVVILWHVDSRKVSYEFLDQGWSLQQDGLDACRAALKKRLTELVHSDHLLPYKAIMPDFYNEHALHLLTRIVHKVLDWGDRIWFFLSGYHPQTYLMSVMALAMFAALGFIIKKLNDAELQKLNKQSRAQRRQTRPPSCTADSQTMHLYELRYETFNNLLKEADTGLTLLILVDEECRQQLLHKFAEIMQPYSRYSALTFGFLQLEYYLSWYQHLLELSVSFKVKLDSINVRNCVGTVLALNGYRKYFYIYHPRNAQRWIKKQCRLGQAMGFVDSDSESEGGDAKENSSGEPIGDKIFVNEVLSGLSLWMDRVFDGSVKKVRVDYWPEMSQ